MDITEYTAELNQEHHNMLVRKNSYDYPTDCVSNPEEVAEMLNTLFRLNKKAEEYVYMIAVDTKSKVLGIFEISHGTVNAVMANPREIFIRALLCGASAIILAHNHPSGDMVPSADDMETYEKNQGRRGIAWRPLDGQYHCW